MLFQDDHQDEVVSRQRLDHHVTSRTWQPDNRNSWAATNFDGAWNYGICRTWPNENWRKRNQKSPNPDRIRQENIKTSERRNEHQWMKIEYVWLCQLIIFFAVVIIIFRIPEWRMRLWKFAIKNCKSISKSLLFLFSIVQNGPGNLWKKHVRLN